MPAKAGISGPEGTAGLDETQPQFILSGYRRQAAEGLG
jgi:hypothetical protein